MAALNKVQIIGYCGCDPELRYLADGGAVANIRIAVTERYKDKDHTEWFYVVFFGKLAEIAAEYLKKGSPAYVEGRRRTETYTDKEGVERKADKLIAERMQLLSIKSSDDSSPKQTSAADYARATGRSFENFEDDIPF